MSDQKHSVEKSVHLGVVTTDQCLIKFAQTEVKGLDLVLTSAMISQEVSHIWMGSSVMRFFE